LYWLFKEEPTHYSYDDLVKDGKTNWSGVKNNLALKYLRTVKRGDLIFYYHTGEEKRVVGIMKAASDAYSLDKENPDVSSSKDIGLEVVPIERFAHPVSLQTIKKDPRFSNFELVRISRLSIMPVTDDQWDAIQTMARDPKS
jgi:predicted RNA-binding protein with PUA-like domain